MMGLLRFDMPVARGLLNAGPGYGPILLQAAEKAYPFIRQYNPVVTVTPGAADGDYAETWPAGETGDAQYPRPASMPLDRVGVDVFRPGEFGPNDLAAEFLHVDPIANQARAHLLASLSPQQIATLKHASGDYGSTIARGESEQDAMRNAVDSALRGYTVGQWPAEANASMGYTPDQMRTLNGLRSYMLRGAPRK